MYYNSFFAGSGWLAKATGSLAAGVGFLVASTHTAASASLTSAIMLAHAMPHTLMLTLPSGARGKLNTHSA